MKRRRLGQFFTSLPSILLPLLPKGACPLCLGAYGGVLSALGLGFMATDRVLAPLIIVAAGISVGSVGLTTMGHRHPGPLTASLIGAGTVVSGRLVWNVPALLYVGLGVLFAASIWNFWLRRPARKPLIQIRDQPTEGDSR